MIDEHNKWWLICRLGVDPNYRLKIPFEGFCSLILRIKKKKKSQYNRSMEPRKELLQNKSTPFPYSTQPLDGVHRNGTFLKDSFAALE